MRPKSITPSSQGRVTTIVDGTVHHGHFVVTGGRYPTIAVTGEHGTKRTQVGAARVEDLARSLLADLVRAGDGSR